MANENALDLKIANMRSGSNTYATGRVRLVREYILEVTGLENVSYFEQVIIGDKGEGYVDVIKRDCVIVALTKINERINIGDHVTATGKEFMVSYSMNSIGHIVDIFGNDLLVGKKLDAIVQRPLEEKPIGIMERTTVNRPLMTGISGIDLMYPIGRGQRQLIIGDKKTGKTQICLDTICNQQDQGMICIYCAIGKTKKEIKDIYSQLLNKGAMAYTVIIAAFNDDPAPMLRNTPYAALSIARGYLESKLDVLVCIDDLKRHADVCREIALLMGKTPGRDAYPPDIFYCHSRMLELGCQHMNGGSITILPICETKSGDITDYISTNIISITDGQIVLSAKNFEKGQKPAINYGLSVSRLGGAVQKPDIKRAGAPLRRELLSYLEQKEVFELANMDEMSPELRRTMRRGARIIEILKQPKFSPRSETEMLNQVAELNSED